MNAKSLLLAAAVLATPACAVSEADIAGASEDAISARVQLKGETFLSRDTFTIRHSRQRPNGEWVTDSIDVRYRLRFIPADRDTYAYDGLGEMEYETLIDTVEVAAPELTHSIDRAYYAKRKSAHGFQLFDCDSSHNCRDYDRVAQLRSWTVDGTKSVAISGLNQPEEGTGLHAFRLEGVDTAEIIFDLAPPAAEYVSLPAAVTCTNGQTLTITPNGTTHQAAAELRDETGTVVMQDDHYGVIRDANGQYFVVGAWAGVRIALGDGSARYDNTVTGASVSFPSGTCR